MSIFLNELLKRILNKTKNFKRNRIGLGAGLYDTNFYLQTRGINPEQKIFQPYFEKYKRKIFKEKKSNFNLN